MWVRMAVMIMDASPFADAVGGWANGSLERPSDDKPRVPYGLPCTVRWWVTPVERTHPAISSSIHRIAQHHLDQLRARSLERIAKLRLQLGGVAYPPRPPAPRP